MALIVYDKSRIYLPDDDGERFSIFRRYIMCLLINIDKTVLKSVISISFITESLKRFILELLI